MAVTEKRNELMLGLLGISLPERRLITSICKLSHTNAARALTSSNVSFSLADVESDPASDIFVVDADNQDSLNAMVALRANKPALPMVLVSKSERQPTHENELVLQRNRIGPLLLRNLHALAEIAINSKAAETDDRKQCLVVDDSQLVRTQMEMILQDYGLDLSFAEDAETGLKLAQDNHFDLIFLDVMLPEMDGYKACKLLKSNPSTRDSKVVMLTSKKSPFNKMHGKLVGCDRYLTKPADSARVHKVLALYGLIQKFSDTK